MKRLIAAAAADTEVADLSRRSTRPRRRLAMFGRVLAVSALVGGMLFTNVTMSGAVHDDGLFELGPADTAGAVTDIAGAAEAVHAGPDWGDLFDAGAGGARSSLKDDDGDGVPAAVDDDDDDDAVGDTDDGFEGVVFVEDPLSSKGLSDSTVFAASNKNNDAISTWRWDSGNNPPKDDLANVYAYAVRAPGVDTDANGIDDLVIYVGIERLAPEGDSHLDVEFNQGGLALDEAVPCNDPGNDVTPCSFIGEKEEDDILIVMDFETGGSLGFVDFRHWNGTEYELDYELGGEGCNEANGLDADVFCAFNNAETINGGGWTNFNRHGQTVTDLEQNAFTEIGFNIPAILGSEPCINTINAKSRSSQSFTSELKDFALHEFDLCNPSTDLAINTTVKDANGDTVDNDAVVIGSEVTFTVTETNDGDTALTLPVAGNRNSLVSSPDCSLVYLSGDTSNTNVFDVGETWTFECDVTLTSTGTFTFDAVGHGIDHLGRDVTWYVTAATDDTDCASASAGDGASLSIDADAAIEVLCDADEVDSLTLTVINPSTDLDLTVDSDDVTDTDPGSGVTWAAHLGDTIDFTIVEANDSNTDLTIPGGTDDETDMIDVDVTFDPSDDQSVKTSDTCDSLTFEADALSDADGDLIAFDDTDPDHADANLDGYADGNGDKVLDAGEAWIFTCSLTVDDEGGTATVTATGHGIDPLGRDVTWYITADEEDVDCGSLDTSDIDDTILCDIDEQDSIVIEILAPSTVLTKTADVTINYTITEMNDGNAPLAEPADGWVTDTQCATVDEVLGESNEDAPDGDGGTPPSDATHNVGDANNNGMLDPGETFEFNCTDTLAGPVGPAYGSTSQSNVATGSGVDAIGAHVTTHDGCSADGDIVVDDGGTEGDTSDDVTIYCDADEADDVTVTIENNQSLKPT